MLAAHLPGPVTARPPALRALGLASCLFAFGMSAAQAQELEPRSYSNTPVGLNFLIAGYLYTKGDVAFDPSTRITDAKYDADNLIFGYAHSLDAWGKSAKFDVVLPYTAFSGHAQTGSETRVREMTGATDPLFRFSMNFFGAPALSLKEFAGYRQDLIIGGTVQVTAPLGQYDNSKLVNLGNNRWSIKTELGASKVWGPWTLELAPSVKFFTDNTDFNRGSTLEQAPIYSMQAHLIYNFPSGKWLAFNGTHYTGGRTTLNGRRGDNMQTNTRAGLTLALPVDRYNSVKLYASSDIESRTGTGFDGFGIAWQYRWGGGY